jgi:cilia- and flagella-associated protein 52
MDGSILDIKRRPTHRYVFASVGKGLLSFWTMDPYAGELVSSRVGTGMQTREFTCLEFSADESRLFAGSTSGDFLVVDVRNLVAVSSVSVCSGGLHSLLVNSNGERVIVGGGDGTVTEHVEHDGEWMSTKRAQFTGAVTSLSASAEGTEIIVGVSQGVVHRMRVTDFESILLSESHAGAVNSVCFPRGVSDRFATSSTDGTLRTWDMSEYATAMTSQRPQSHADVRVWPTCIAHISECVVSGWSDGKIHGFDVESGEHLWLVDNSHKDGVGVIRASNNERFFMSGGRDGAVRVWDLRTRQMVVNLKEHVQPVTDLSVFSDDAHILSCARDKSILCWDLRSEKRIASYVQRMGGLNSIALTRDEAQFLSVGTERRVSLWDMRLPEPVKASPYSTGGEGVKIKVSHDGNYFAVGGTDELVHVWDYRMFQPVSVGRGHSDGILDLEFSPDDRQIVTVGKDGCVFIWNVWHD